MSGPVAFHLGMLAVAAIMGFAAQMIELPPDRRRQRRIQLAAAIALLPVVLVSALQALGVHLWPQLSAVDLAAALLGSFSGLALALLARALLRKGKSPGP